MASNTFMVKNVIKSQTIYDLEKLDFKLSSDDKKMIQTLLPPPEKKITFEIHNTDACMANGLKRAITDEIPIVSFTCTIDSITTTDRKLRPLVTSIIKRIQLIGINQEFATNSESLLISLHVENDTHDIIRVTSGHIIIKSGHPQKIMAGGKVKSNQIMNITDYFSDKIGICELDPGKNLHIESITFITNRNYELAIGGLVHSFIYVPTQFEELLLSTYKGTKKLPSSLETHPTIYRLGFTLNHVSMKPETIVKLACNELLRRFTQVKKEIQESDGEVPYYSPINILEITQPHLTHYKIFNESWTMGNFLAWYGYNIDVSIDFIAAANEHALIHTIIIKIQHQDHQKVLMSAIDNIITDLKVVHDAV